MEHFHTAMALSGESKIYKLPAITRVVIMFSSFFGPLTVLAFHYFIAEIENSISVTNFQIIGGLLDGPGPPYL